MMSHRNKASQYKWSFHLSSARTFWKMYGLMQFSWKSYLCCGRYCKYSDSVKAHGRCTQAIELRKSNCFVAYDRMMLPARADVPICWASLWNCYVAEGTLFFSFSFHPTSFSVIFFICFQSSLSSSSSSNLSFCSLLFLYLPPFPPFPYVYSIPLLCYSSLFFPPILFILNLPLHYPLLW